MSTMWVMVIWIYSTGYPVAITTAEFASEQTCISAAAAIGHQGRYYVMQARCVKK